MHRSATPKEAVPVAVQPLARPALVYLKLFDNCNLRCQMCDCWQLPRTRLSGTRAHAVLTSVLSAEPAAIRFTGGEPLLFRQLGELLRRTKENGARAVVISNGRLLDRRIDELVAAGLDELVVSVDGPETVHDAIRGLTSLGGLRRGLVGIADHVVLGVNTVVQRENFGLLEPTLDLLLELPVRPTWWHLIPVRGAVHGLNEAEAEAGSKAVTAAIAAASALGIEVLADAAMFSEDGAPCSVPQHMVYVDAVTGEAFGCNMLAYTDEAVGNVLEQPLASILRGRSMAHVRQACATGGHAACSRCDPSSRLMNRFFRSQYL